MNKVQLEVIAIYVKRTLENIRHWERKLKATRGGLITYGEVLSESLGEKTLLDVHAQKEAECMENIKKYNWQLTQLIENTDIDINSILNSNSDQS